MKKLYTATFVIKDGTYYARVPDLSGCITTGTSLEEALDLITDAANLWVVANEDLGNPIPEATPQSSINQEGIDACSIILVDTLAYRAATDTHAVRKNVSLPAWMANLADQKGINCSQLLQESLMEKLA